MKIVIVLLISFFQLFALSWQENHLLSLEKITVGPFDNYQASVYKNQLFFTRSKNQIVQVYEQNLTSRMTQRILASTIDAKDPAISPDGRFLALTSFANDAQGDICIYSLHDKNTTCFGDAIEHSPFWIDANHLGYIKQLFGTNISELIVLDIKKKTKKVLLRGIINAPSASFDGRYIVFYRKTSQKKGLCIYDRKEQKEFGPFAFDLPGLSSYARFSRDGKYLYFSHYLNDTTEDQHIDGRDHSVIFRIEVQKLFHTKKPLLPQQLTSVNQNCNFPFLSEKYLYLTCAYEGSLDIYRLPLTGRVPTTWQEKELKKAHDMSTNYEDKLLLLNTLAYLFPKNYEKSKISFLERELSNHLEIGELSASKFFVKELQTLYHQNHQQYLADFYHNVAILLDIQSQIVQEPQKIKSVAFALAVKKESQKIKMSADGELFYAWIDSFFHRDKKALKELRQIVGKKLPPLGYYLAMQLEKKLFLPKVYLQQLFLASQNKALTKEAQLYYTFAMLDEVSRIKPNPKERKKELLKILKKMQFHQSIVQNEINIIDLLEAKEKHKAFKKSAKYLKTIKDPLESRIAHIRAIFLFQQAKEYKYMELFSRHWLIVAHIKEIGFYDIAQQYSIITTKKAYGMFNDKNYQSALNTFYSEIRQINDLEAIYNFVTIGYVYDTKLKQQVKKSLTLLQKGHILKENSEFAKALILLIKEKETKENLEQAKTILQHMQAMGLTPAMKNLLLGYVYHRLLELSHKDNGEYDVALYKKAHYQYMLALDLAYDNQRIQSAVLENLGMLHFSVGNYALSTHFFAQRSTLPFLNIQSEASFRWHFARALFYYNHYKQAKEEGDKAYKLAQKAHRDVIAFMQQDAFYNLYAQEYEQASFLYQKVIKNLQGINRAKALLGYGYSLKKLHKCKQATKQFQKLLQLTPSLEHLPKNRYRLIDFEPKRLELLAYGFLVSCETDRKKQQSYLAKRVKILKDMKGNVSDFAYDEKTRLEFLIKTLQQEAVIYEKEKELNKMGKVMSEALQLLPLYIKEGGAYSSQVMLRTLDNYLALSILYPKAFHQEEKPLAKSLTTKTIQALTYPNYTPPLIKMEQKKLQKLLTKF